MPLASETLQNKPLSGQELLEVILNDLQDLLSKDGMFRESVGYGRVAYKLTLELEMDNLTYPKHLTSRATRPETLDSPGPDALALSKSRSRQLVSPNATRVLNDLPIKVTSVQGGRLVEHEVLGYDKSEVPPQPGPVDADWSESATKALQERAGEALARLKKRVNLP